MATAAQALANRANAQLSTGPRTLEGKLASASNAVTTGLTASKLFIRPDEQPEFEVFLEGLRNELQPGGTVENLLFDRILHAAWNLRRCDALEYKIQNEAFLKNLDDAGEDETLARQLDRIYRYRKMHESSQRRAMADLRQLQTEQVRRRENQELLEESILVETTAIIRALSVKNVREDKALAKLAEAHVRAVLDGPVPQRR